MRRDDDRRMDGAPSVLLRRFGLGLQVLLLGDDTTTVLLLLLLGEEEQDDNVTWHVGLGVVHGDDDIEELFVGVRGGQPCRGLLLRPAGVLGTPPWWDDDDSEVAGAGDDDDDDCVLAFDALFRRLEMRRLVEDNCGVAGVVAAAAAADGDDGGGGNDESCCCCCCCSIMSACSCTSFPAFKMCTMDSGDRPWTMPLKTLASLSWETTIPSLAAAAVKE
jgi:hypothetical protein